MWLSIFLAAAIALPVGKPVEHQLAGKESHDYLFTLDAGQYARVAVKQHTVNVAVACFGPDDKELFSADTHDIGDTETCELVAGRSGGYRVRVSAPDEKAPPGRYEITLQQVEAATVRHRRRIAGARSFAYGMSAYRQDARKPMLKSIAHFEHALASWKSAGAHVEVATALYMIGLTHAQVGDQQKALHYTTQALSIARATQDRMAEGRALEAVGEVHTHFAKLRTAVDCYEQALPLLRAAGDRAGEGNALNNLGVTLSRMGEKRKALLQFDKAVAVYRKLQDGRKIAEVAGNIGLTYDNLGEYQRALEIHERNLVFQREMANRSSEAVTLNNIGSVYSGLGAYQKALNAYIAALEINRHLENRWNVAINLNNLGWVYASLGDRQRALNTYNEALGIFRTVKDQKRVATALNNIAGIYADLGDYRKAVELHQEALSFRRAAGDGDGEANSLNNLGKSYAKIGDRHKARDLFERALAIHRTNGNRHMLSRTLRNLGALNFEAGVHQQALEYLDQALAISRAIHDRSGEAAALAELARVERSRGDLVRAHQRAGEAQSALEWLRLAVASPALRASFFATARDVQELDIDVLMRLHAQRPDDGFDAAALFVSEKARARSLLELLGEISVEIRRGVDVALLDREVELQRLISAKADQQMRLLSGRHTESDAASAAKELDALTSNLEQVQSRIRETSPHYAALTRPVPLSLREIQTEVLDSDTVLLEYALGAERSFLWVVSTSAIDVFELPPRAEIESAATKMYELLTARNRKLAKETPASRAARVRQSDEAWFDAAMKASRMLLEPAASRIEGKRIVIVGEGVLQYLPFAALPEPALDAAKAAPLIAKHEIISAPSASVLATLRRETAGRKPAPKTLAVLADPVFSMDDARVVRQQKALKNAAASDEAAGQALRSASEVGVQEFVRLRFSRQEAEEIARFAPPEMTLKALDFDASRETVLRPDIGQHRIVHFATHSLLNSKRPELSGVVLSLVDQTGKPQNGFLRLYDIYNLRLASDLVVLSACRTALGREIKGEGLIGLTRGFLYAGAPRVIASLWEVDDRTSAELMKRFYEGMLGRGERPAAALKNAQAAMWKTKGWDAPYFWAAYTLQGEWR